MTLRFRLLGLLIMACGAALCYGAVELWPTGTVAAGSVVGWVVGVLRVAGAALAVVLGVFNVVAGFAVFALDPARQ